MISKSWSPNLLMISESIFLLSSWNLASLHKSLMQLFFTNVSVDSSNFVRLLMNYL